MLATGAVANLQARIDLVDGDHRFSRALSNVRNGLALGAIFNSAIAAQFQNFSISSLTTLMLAPCLISVAISGLAYVARRNNYYPEQMDAMEHKLGKLLDVSSRLASVATLLLLVPSASASPLFFTVTAGLVGYNLWHSYLVARKPIQEIPAKSPKEKIEDLS
jgi:hypothetical protein